MGKAELDHLDTNDSFRHKGFNDYQELQKKFPYTGQQTNFYPDFYQQAWNTKKWGIPEGIVSGSIIDILDDLPELAEILVVYSGRRYRLESELQGYLQYDFELETLNKLNNIFKACKDKPGNLNDLIARYKQTDINQALQAEEALIKLFKTQFSKKLNLPYLSDIIIQLAENTKTRSQSTNDYAVSKYQAPEIDFDQILALDSPNARSLNQLMSANPYNMFHFCMSNSGFQTWLYLKALTSFENEFGKENDLTWAEKMLATGKQIETDLNVERKVFNTLGVNYLGNVFQKGAPINLTRDQLRNDYLALRIQYANLSPLDQAHKLLWQDHDFKFSKDISLDTENNI
jgi:hypothetical protein